VAVHGIMAEPRNVGAGVDAHAKAGESSMAGSPSVSAAVIAGGESRRMGRDKRSLTVGSETLLARVTAVLRSVSDDVLISCRDNRQVPGALARELGARRVFDRAASVGPLGGIAAALRAARHRHVVIVAVDMPFLSPDLLRLVAHRAVRADEAVVACSARGIEPLLASYPKRAALCAEELMALGTFSVTAFADALRPRLIGPDEWHLADPTGGSFVNWNLPADLQGALVPATREASA
jgi:molybdopterin-guanine dinucleotide biosynthesis protein A